MSREIKFRGISEETGEFVFGFFRISGSGNCIIDELHNTPRTMQDPCGDCVSIANVVKYESVGQYTGLKDKSGVEIFEGDKFNTQVCISPDGISSAHNNFHWIDVGCVVVFENGSFWGEWKLENHSNHKYTFNRSGKVRVCDECNEVIGSTHSNPELLNKDVA